MATGDMVDCVPGQDVDICATLETVVLPESGEVRAQVIPDGLNSMMVVFRIYLQKAHHLNLEICFGDMVILKSEPVWLAMANSCTRDAIGLVVSPGFTLLRY